MKPWARLLFSISSLAILTTIGVKLHELDMPVARFVRSFDIDEINRIGDFLAVPGRGAVIAGVFLLIGLFGWRLKRDRLKDIAVRGLVTLLCVTAATQLLKHLVGRPRPRFAHADEFFLGPSLDSGLDAFPSGHSLDAFGAASVLAWFVPALRVPVFLIAGLVGVSRVVRGSHFPTDVFAGAVLGVVIGSLVAAGFKRWWEEVLPALIRTGVPIAVSVFWVVWVVLHPMPTWSREVWHLGAGATLILAGMLARGLAIVRQGEGGRSVRVVGGAAVALGAAVASAPWWIASLLVVALVPMSLMRIQPDTSAPTSFLPFWTTLPLWRREAFVLGLGLLAIAAFRSVRGLIPIG